MNFDSQISRRSALVKLACGATTLYFTGCAGTPFQSGGLRQGETPGRSPSPVDRSEKELWPSTYSGDQPERAHAALWDKQTFISAHGGLPPISERLPLVVVGGGISGLSTAYLLRKHRPVLLEQSPQFGGNSKGESWQGIDYSIGAAYLSEPDRGTPLDLFVNDLGLRKVARAKQSEDPIEINGAVYQGLFEGAAKAAGAARSQSDRLSEFMRNVLEEKDGQIFPYIPTDQTEMRNYLNRLDRISFKAFLEKKLGARLDPTLENEIEFYCYSSFNATASEVSAAGGINFYAADFGQTLVLPGGNSKIAEILFDRLGDSLPAESLRPSSLVIDVRVVGEGVQVTYQNAGGKLVSVLAGNVVMSCPKFVAAKVIDGLEKERVAAIRKLKYRSYLVANALIEGPPSRDFFDMYLLNDGKLRVKKDQHLATDVISANFAASSPTHSVLTLYRGMPYDGGRAMLYATDSHSRIRSEFEAQIHRQVLPALGINPKRLKGLRLSRWGHPLPVNQQGIYTNGVVDLLRKPFRDRVFFVEQDNWMLPSFESAAGEAISWAPHIEKSLLKA